MADNKELKPKSFRISDETAEKFKEITSTIGGNQQDALSKLIEAYEFQAGKSILTDKKADIEQFERYVTVLTRMYMSSLEDNQNVTLTVRSEFEAMLKSKDAVIQDLQEKVNKAVSDREDVILKVKDFEAENERLCNTVNEIAEKNNDLKNMLADKDNLNKALTDSCNDLKAKFEQVRSLADLKEDYELLQKQQEHLQLTHEREILDLNKSYQEQIQALKEEYQKKIDEYQSKYLGLLEQMRK